MGEGGVTVRLPEAEILSHEMDEGSVEIFDEKASIFNPFTVEDFAAFQAEQKDAMEQKALESRRAVPWQSAPSVDPYIEKTAAAPPGAAVFAVSEKKFLAV